MSINVALIVTIIALLLVIVILLILISVNYSKARAEHIIYQDNLEIYKNKADSLRRSINALDATAGLLLTVEGCTMVSSSEISEIVKSR